MPLINGLGGGGEDVTKEVVAQTEKLTLLKNTLAGKAHEPLWLTTETGEYVAPLIPQNQQAQVPTASAPQIAAGYTAYGTDGMVQGSGKVVKNLIYGITLSRLDAGNGRFYAEIPSIDISKISVISAVANGINSNSKAGLTITNKKDNNPLGYIITSLSVDDAAPVQTEHVITNGVLRLEAFGAQNTKITYSVVEEN